MTGEVEAAATAALDRRLDRSSPAPLAVAVSGGGDSMALLHLAADWARGAGRDLRVLTVDHGLDPHSGAWAERVRAAARSRGLSCDVLRWEGDKRMAGLPAAARAARHALLAEATQKAGACVLLMGHTADDLAEAEIMRAGGSSVPDPREWAPSPAWPEGRGLFLLRPLLALSRGSLRAFLQSRGEAWIDDPANNDLRFARARARTLIPSHLVGEGGARAPDEGSGAGAPSRVELACARSPEGTAGRGLLCALPRATPHPSAPRLPSPIRGEGTHWGGLIFPLLDIEEAGLLSAAVVCASGGSQPPRSAKLAKLAARLGDRSAVTSTLSGARVVSSGSLVLFGRDPGRAGLPSTPAREGESLVWDGRFEVFSQEAGTVAPLAGRTARLSGAERSSLAPVPVWARPTLPVLETAAGAVRLLPEARPLALERLRAACGVYGAEPELPPF